MFQYAQISVRGIQLVQHVSNAIDPIQLPPKLFICPAKDPSSIVRFAKHPFVSIQFVDRFEILVRYCNELQVLFLVLFIRTLGNDNDTSTNMPGEDHLCRGRIVFRRK